jgi:two-component system phosphate regulon sensor histidine kinase PhoR
VQRVEDEACDWRALAFAFGTLLNQQITSQPDTDDRLVGVVVHELRTPVAIIKAYAELLEAQAAVKHTTANGSREVMGHILEQADLMADWVDAMLDVQRLQLGELRLETTHVDLVQLAWTVAAEFQQTTQRHRIRVVASRPAPPPIVGDRSRLRQVLSNLLENAVKYSAGGTIQVRVALRPGPPRQAIVSVHDQGPGLESAQLDRIFAPFEAEQRSVGLGLGLYLARQIAQIHGGDVWAESRGRMGGSTFSLVLPV